MNSSGRYSLSRRRQRGAIFLAALGIIVILCSLLLVFASDMRTEVIGSANRLSYIQADAVEQGAEKWVLAQIEANAGDTTTIVEAPAEAIPIGTGYFWVLRANPDADDQYDFGITDESSKLNLNSASETQLLAFPSMTVEVADAIIDWRNSSSSVGTIQKDAPFETVEELNLVEGVTPEMLYGFDRNRDGVIDDAERAAAGSSSIFNTSGASGRGLIHYLTAYTVQANSRININSRNSNDSFRTAMRNAGIAESRVNTILNTWRDLVPNRGRGNFRNLGDFYSRLGLQISEFKLFADKVTTRTGAATGLINPATASRDVLLTLVPDEADVDKLISARQSVDTTTFAWVFDALGDATKAANLVDSATTTSSQYSADIVAVSGDGRSYKRARIVIDATSTPAKIVYRKDLTSFGWPLPQEVRQAMRTAQPPVTGYARVSGSSGKITF